MTILRNIQLIDVNGNPLGQSTSENFLNTTAIDYQTQIARGNGPVGSYRWEALGFNPSSTQNVMHDIWEGGSLIRPQPSATGERVALKSTSIDDSSAGTGVKSVYIHYINSTGSDSVEIISLSGTTEVQTTANDIRFINSIHTDDVGSNGTAVGNIICYKIGSPSTVYDIISAGGNRSLSCATMVPAGKKLFITSWSVGTATTDAPASFFLRSTSHIHVEYPGVFIFQDTISLNSTSSYRAFGVPLLIPSLAIVKISCRSGSNKAATVSGSWEGWIE